VALVTQEHHIFIGSLLENLSLAKPDATSEEIESCLASVDALEWATALPQGLETELGTTGFSLTPAQAQQLALARLVLANPHTLVLDEGHRASRPSRSQTPGALHECSHVWQDSYRNCSPTPHCSRCRPSLRSS